MRKVIGRLEAEDSTSLGGWLFADSFLALMVIFLATISFVPTLGGSVSNAGSVGNIAGASYSKGLNLVYEKFDASQIQKDINAFELQEKLSTNSSVIYAKVVGGYDPKIEGATKGNFRALLFSAQLRASQLQIFNDTKLDLGASEKIKPTQIVLRLTLAGN